jgi:hypothetical protein
MDVAAIGRKLNDSIVVTVLFIGLEIRWVLLSFLTAQLAQEC